MTRDKLPDLRNDYDKKTLQKTDLHTDPVIQFENWLAEALQYENEIEANAMVLATTNSQNRPSARVVLLKDISDDGFIFFTNYHSRKARELEFNPFGSLVFWWRSLQRQVRIEGKLKKVDSKISENYFKSRPLQSQIGASISPQSSVIPNRHFLSDQFIDLEKEIKEGKILKRPEFWGGYALIPDQFEFWQGRQNRLHDRFQYRLKDQTWIIERLAP